MSHVRSWFSRFGPWVFVGAVAAVGCSGGGSPATIVIPCDPMDPSSCPQDEGFAQICSLADGNVCVNVCQGATALPGGCEVDTDCSDGFDCDNDKLGGESTCQCVCDPAFEVGGTAEAPIIWEEKYTCVDEEKQCFSGGASDNNEPITFSLVQNGKDVTGTVVAGPGTGDVFEGQLCGTEFRWIDVTPGAINPEQGCWTFTEDAFNKRSYATDDFDCVGIGTRGAGSVPPDVISCQDFGSVQLDIMACPDPPPTPPEGG